MKLVKALARALGVCLLVVSLPILFLVGISALILAAIPVALLCVAVVCFAVE